MLQEYVMGIAKRGACTCGRCADAPPEPNAHQPAGHTVNLTLFEVAQEGGDSVALRRLVEDEYPALLDGKEHNYIEMGGELGDQGTALMLIGVGHLLGLWKALSPDTILPDMPDNLKQQMAGGGMVALQAARKEV